jgi:hypothetical protein
MKHTHFFNPALTWQAPGSELASSSVPPDLSRQPLAMLTEIACALFHSSEAMRKIQQQAAHHALLRHETAMRKLHAACTPTDLLDIESDLLRFDLEKASHYWQQLAAVALQTQIEIWTSASHLHGSHAGSKLKSTMSASMDAFQAALPLVNGFYPSKPRHYALV